MSIKHKVKMSDIIDKFLGVSFMVCMFGAVWYSHVTLVEKLLLSALLSMAFGVLNALGTEDE